MKILRLMAIKKNELFDSPSWHQYFFWHTVCLNPVFIISSGHFCSSGSDSGKK